MLDIQLEERQASNSQHCLRVKNVQHPHTTLCGNVRETIEHLFLECHYVVDIWDKVVLQMLHQYGVRNLQLKNVIFGFYAESEIEQGSIFVNHVILLVKYFIYKCRLSKVKPTWDNFCHYLNYVENVERQIAIKHNKIERHVSKWGPYIE